jgi:predicted SAM-dependent methyltransferase
MILNVGGTNLDSQKYLNLDKSTGWLFQDGIECLDNSVDAITEGHALMWLKTDELVTFLKECYRVLKPGGVMRITQDDACNPKSDTYHTGWKNRQIVTCPTVFHNALEEAGFTVYHCGAKETHYKNDDLLQDTHQFGNPDRVFYIEGVKCK